jgi:hypothetical protein
VNNPSNNFAPQLGVAWDPTGRGTIVIRGGAGLYYENIIYNNVLFDRPLRLKTGAFNQVSYGCFSGTPAAVAVAGGTITPDATSCGNSLRIGDAIPAILAFSNAYKAGNPFDLKAPNPNYIGNLLGAGLGVPLGMLAPDYKTPVSVQMNIGIERQIRPGMVLSVDLLNFANFNLPPVTMSGFLNGTPGSINGTTPADNNAGFRVGNGTGVYAVGAPRQIEWGMRLTF